MESVKNLAQLWPEILSIKMMDTDTFDGVCCFHECHLLCKLSYHEQGCARLIYSNWLDSDSYDNPGDSTPTQLKSQIC